MKKVLSCLFVLLFLVGCKKELTMPDFYNKNFDEFEEFVIKNNIKYEIKETYSDLDKDKIVWQNISPNKKIPKDSTIVITKSLGIDYKKYNVDESGNVPIMMYHGIVNLKDEETGYIGGNVDRDGYTRTVQSFKRDLDFYYNEGYRMISLKDYINGDIDVALGKSPIILTFDDGLSNNIKVTGLDENGNIIIDENSAVGVLESYKKKYPDFNITATFFINEELFSQEKYNDKILKWLIDNGYDVGNHTISHVDFTEIDSERTQKEVGLMYQKLNSILGDKYVNIVALPYGSPYTDDDNNFKYIIDGNYNDIKYHTDSTLRVGWEADYSPFNKNFNKQFLKRIRAYDNNGKEFDIEMNFEILKKNRYISDGNVDRIVVPNSKKDKINESYNKGYIYYD